jgi:hypothetical protein
MKSPLMKLIGLDIISITFIHDYLQIGFAGGWGLTINNRYTWSTQDSVSMIGAKLVDLESEGGILILVFSNGEKLTVDFTEDGFRHPEGMLLQSDLDKVPIVWDETSIGNPLG